MILIQVTTTACLSASNGILRYHAIVLYCMLAVTSLFIRLSLIFVCVCVCTYLRQVGTIINLHDARVAFALLEVQTRGRRMRNDVPASQMQCRRENKGRSGTRVKDVFVAADRLCAHLFFG